jgi:hypothetical protein
MLFWLLPSGLENREYGSRDSSRWSRVTFYLQKLALTSLTSGGRSVGIVHWRTQATEISLVFWLLSGGIPKLCPSGKEERRNTNFAINTPPPSL